MFERFFGRKNNKASAENAEFKQQHISNREVRELLKTAIGPAPWYWNTFPEIKTKNGNHYKWNYDKSKIDWVPFLEKKGENNGILMILNSYISAFALPQGELGVWYPKGKYSPYKFLGIEFEIFDVDKLKIFSFSDIPKDFKKEKGGKRYYCNGKSISKFFIPSNLRAGDNNFKFPDIFKPLDEFVFVCGYRYEKAAYSIIQLLPRESKIVLYPQYWFNADDFDLGYEWITRVIKHPQNGRFYGDGIRVSAFEVAEDGCNFSRLINASESA